MSQKELNLFQFTTSLMTQTGTCPAKIVRGERRNLTVLRLLLHYTPNDLRTEAGSPDSAGLVDRTKKSAARDAGGSRPAINSCFNPMRHWNRANVSIFANKVGNNPVILPLLNVLNSQSSQLGSPQAAAQQNGERGVVALSSET
jgi:hypothetical protein